MSSTRLIQRSYIGGEMSPEMFGRLEDVKFQNGAARLRNMIVGPKGNAIRRPGFKYVGAVKDSTKATRLIPFVYSADDSLVLEVGVGYFRFHANGATVGYGSLSAFVPQVYLSTSSAGGFTNGFDAANDKFKLAAAHTFTTGLPVSISKSGTATLPPELAFDTVYYIIVGGALASDEFRLATTQSNALGGTYIALSGTSNGGASERRLHRVYEVADMVSYTVGPTTHYYYHTAESYTIHAEGDPTTTAYWYAMPDTGQYEIPNTYLESELFDISYFQSADVMTLLHPDHSPAELRRYGATDWVLADITFSAQVTAPTGLAGVASPGRKIAIASVTGLAGGGPTYPAQFLCGYDHHLTAGDPVLISGMTADSVTLNYDYDVSGDIGQYVVYKIVNSATFQLARVTDGSLLYSNITPGGSPHACTHSHVRYTSLSSENSQEYVVTAVDSNNAESGPSSSTTVTNNLLVEGSYNTLTWNAVTGAKRYHIYKLSNGLFGFIGSVSADETRTFKDDNIGPDLGLSPPITDSGFINGIDPGAGCYFEQRRVFAADDAQPQSIWMTRSGTESDMTYHIPTVDSDRIYFAISSREPSYILHCVPMDQLILMTNTCEYRVTPVNSDAITPSSISVRPQSYIGCNSVRPLVSNNAIVFAAARGGHVRELGYRSEVNGFATGDLSLRASHLFDGLTIVDSAQSKAPIPIMWFVSSDGKLLGLTYIPEEQIGAWHSHDTDGTFESIACVSEGIEDHLYAIVLHGSVRYVVRMADMYVNEDAPEDLVYSDLSVTKTNGTATASWTGLTHLASEDVVVLGDGAVLADATVTAGGALTTSAAALKIQVGLPYTSDVQSLPLVMQIDGFGQGRTKNVNEAYLRIYQSGDFYIGPGTDQLTRAAVETGLLSDIYRVRLLPDWTQDGGYVVRQSDPLPLNIVGVAIEAAIGG